MNTLKETLLKLNELKHEKKRDIKELDLVILTEILAERELERILNKIYNLKIKVDELEAIEKIIVSQYNTLVDTIENSSVLINEIEKRKV